jgi:uncharacterized membrane protein
MAGAGGGRRRDDDWITGERVAGAFALACPFATAGAVWGVLSGHIGPLGVAALVWVAVVGLMYFALMLAADISRSARG